MSQQPQISSSSSEGAGQTAEASAALQSLYKFAGSPQQDGASSRAPGVMSYRQPKKAETHVSSPGNDQQGALLTQRLQFTIILHPDGYVSTCTATPQVLHANQSCDKGVSERLLSWCR